MYSTMKSAGKWCWNQSSFSNGTCTWANDIEPESNHTSSTSATRRIVDFPVGSSGLGRVSSSTYGRCRSGSPSRSRGSRPKSRSSSSNEP